MFINHWYPSGSPYASETWYKRVFHLRFMRVGRSKGDIYSIEVFPFYRILRANPYTSVLQPQGTCMVSVPMASSRLLRAIFVSWYQVMYIDAGSSVYSVQEVHVARASKLFLHCFFFFFFSSYSFKNSFDARCECPLHEGCVTRSIEKAYVKPIRKR